MRHSEKELNILIVAYIFILAFILVFNRPIASDIEKRDLTRFPSFTFGDYFSGNFNKNLSKWFSDTIPFRDKLVSLSFNIKKLNGIETEFSTNNVVLEEINDDEISIEPISSNHTDNNVTLASTLSEPMFVASTEDIATSSNFDIDDVDFDYAEYDQNKKYLITGKGSDVRVMTVFAGASAMKKEFPETINAYKEIFSNINVYLMVVPTSAAFYCPTELRKYTGDQRKFLDLMIPYLNNKVKFIDVYNVLNRHADEYIYLRTDHHWAPLGAYYAAKEFAKIAGVDFKSLDSYERFDVENYVGSLYSFSKDDRLKEYPDNFIYYLPKNIAYNTLQCRYVLDDKGKPISKTDIKETEFFSQYTYTGEKRGYIVYMGGDQNTTYVNMPNNHTGRNLLILKDSFGNPVPSFLFYSFDNIVVVDYRYYLDNIAELIRDSNITDILFINNVETAMKDIASKRYRKFLNLVLNANDITK